MDYDPSYQTVLDVRGSEGIQVAQWVLSNLASRDVRDVHIQIQVDGGVTDVDVPVAANGGGTIATQPAADGGTPATTSGGQTTEASSTPGFDTDREYELADGEPKDVSPGSRPHKALAMLAEYEDANGDEPWADTQSLYDMRPDVFRNPQDLSAAMSTLYNDKALLARGEVQGSRGYVYRPTPHARGVLSEYEFPF